MDQNTSPTEARRTNAHDLAMELGLGLVGLAPTPLDLVQAAIDKIGEHDLHTECDTPEIAHALSFLDHARMLLRAQLQREPKSLPVDYMLDVPLRSQGRQVEPTQASLEQMPEVDNRGARRGHFAPLVSESHVVNDDGSETHTAVFEAPMTSELGGPCEECGELYAHKPNCSKRARGGMRRRELPRLPGRRADFEAPQADELHYTRGVFASGATHVRVKHDCPACGASSAIEFTTAPQRVDPAAFGLSGSAREMRCANCGKSGRVMPGMSDRQALDVFAQVHAEGAGLPLVPRKRYRIVFRTATQRVDHESVMDFMCRDRNDVYADDASLLFSARPVAGTQRMARSWIKSVTEVPKDTPIIVDRRARS